MLLQPRQHIAQAITRKGGLFHGGASLTGARLNEITQSRESDLKPEVNPDHRSEVIWMLDITPAAGTVKTGLARKVPLHPHLIEQGFLSYVQTRVGLPLFYDPKRARKKSEKNPYFKKNW